MRHSNPRRNSDLRPGSARRPAATRLAVEVLEGRVLPAAPVIPLDNFGRQGAALRGFEDSALAGGSVSGAGDVNGDGFADVIVGATGTNVAGIDRGEVYVFFGGNNLATLHRLDDLGTRGFTLRGFASGAEAGVSVSGAGDVNGDGFADIIIGAKLTNAGGTDRGEAYVVFGGSTLAGSTISLNALGTGGFTLRGFEDGANAGCSVSGAGDFNRDGFADVIVGADHTNVFGSDRGQAYVVFGGSTLGGTTVTLNALGMGGFTLSGFENNALAGGSVSEAGDFNGDGYADIIIGAKFTNVGGSDRGAAYVIYGRSTAAGDTIALDAPGFGSLTVRGFEDFAFAGCSVSGAGDVNGDGLGDVILGAYGTDNTIPGSNRGTAYVLFGRPGFATLTEDLDSLGSDAFRIQEAVENGVLLGFSVSGAGDVNGDGFADVLVGEPNADAGGTNRGAAYVVYGGADLGGTIASLNNQVVGYRGFAINGFETNSDVGSSVAGAGDFNGDGLSDLIVGAPLTNALGTDQGTAYVIYAPLPPTIAVGTDAGATGKVTVYDARSGQPRTTLKPYGDAFTGGIRVSTADINRDGADDVICAPGPGPAQNIRIYNGRTLGLLSEFSPYGPGFTGGVFVATGDVNGDLTMDIMIGAGPGGGPHVKVLNGLNVNQEFFSYFAYDATFTGGVVVGLGDLTADGRADLITAAGPGGGPHVRAINGATGAELHSFFAYAPTFTGGVWLAAGDVTGDGKADIITGAGAGGTPHVKVFHGATRALVHSYFAYGTSFTGGVRVASADVNGDLRPDVVTGAGPGGGPHVKAFRGTDTFLLQSYFAADPGFLGGIFVG